MSERRAIFLGRLKRREREGEEAGGQEEVLEIDPGALSGVFAAPKWMRDLGFSAWLLVGVGAALVGAILLLSLTQTIVMPVLTAGIIASVASPLVDWLRRRGIPRALGAGLVFLLIVAVGVGVGLIVLAGISSQADNLSERLREGASEIESALHSLGVNASTAVDANADADASISAGFEALTHGLLGGIDKLASLAVFLSFTALSLFFLLKDGPTIGGFVERHLGVPAPVGHSILNRLAGSLRGYFVGVTAVAAWSALIVGAGAMALGVPLAGTIAVVTFVGGFVPYLGRLDGGRVRGPDRPRRPRPRGGIGACRRRPAGQRRPATAGPADRLRRGPETASTGRPDRDDRGRLSLRRDRAGAGSAAAFRRRTDLRRPQCRRWARGGGQTGGKQRRLSRGAGPIAVVPAAP